MRTKCTLILIFLSLMILNCATFRSEIKHKFDTPASKNYNADKVSVCFIFSHYRQTKGYDAIPKLDDQYQIIRGFNDFFNDALQELSNIQKYSTFTEYASDVNNPERRATKDSLMQTHDFVMKMKFYREKSFANYFLGELVSTLSLTLLPIPYAQSYAVELDLYNSNGQLIKSYSRRASLKKWVQTLLIFIYPFHTEKRKKEEIYVDFLHDIFKQIETERVLLKKTI